MFCDYRCGQKIFNNKIYKGEIMAGPLNGAGVRDTILSQGKAATESAAYFWGNVTKGV